MSLLPLTTMQTLLDILLYLFLVAVMFLGLVVAYLLSCWITGPTGVELEAERESKARMRHLDELGRQPSPPASALPCALRPEGQEPPGSPDAGENDCPTCQGLGTIDETLGGYSFSDPEAPCPDCRP